MQMVGVRDVRRSDELYSLCKILYKGAVDVCKFQSFQVFRWVGLAANVCYTRMDSFPSVCVCRTMETSFRCIYKPQIDDHLLVRS